MLRLFIFARNKTMKKSILIKSNAINKKMKYNLFIFFFLLTLFSCKEKNQNVSFEKKVPSVDALINHSQEFDTSQVIKVTEGVYVAVGFGLANSIMIEGKNGNIIVDCMESNEAAQKVKTEFEKLNNNPTKAIIYTHNHADHIFGAGVFVAEDNPEIYSHELTNYYINRLLNVVRPIVGRRSYRMFGNKIDADNHINCGIGLKLDADKNTNRSLVRPTITFKDKLEIDIEGVKIQLAHVPGETNDQLYVWLPEKKTLLCGDNFYKAFPNLYTIRGTPYRDVKEWASSLDKMRYLQPEFLVPSHTQPIEGVENIENILRDYADAIRFVHDQTIRYMNAGFSPDEITEKVILPDHLSQSPYLQEFYGRVDWSVKNIFNGYLGWFDGNASTLLPMPKKEQAEKMAALAGGVNKLLENVQNAFDKKDFQWALELTDHLIRLNPEDNLYKEIRYECLTNLGAQQSNPNARNYFLSQALELKGQSMDLITKPSLKMVHQTPMEAIFNSIAVNTNPTKSADYNKKAVFHFTDTDEKWSIQIRKGVAEIQPFTIEGADLMISTTSPIWKEIVGKIKKPAMAIAKGDLKIEGGMRNFSEFMGMFAAQ